MEKTYHIEFESDAQRAEFEALLQEMGVAFREVAPQGVQEPESEYRAAPEETPEFRAYALREIQLGIEDAEAGRTVPWAEVNSKLEERLSRYRKMEDGHRGFFSAC